MVVFLFSNPVKSILDFFLEKYLDLSEAEQHKARYLLYLLLLSFTYVLAVLTGQIFFSMGVIYISGDLIGLGGVTHALILFRNRRLEAAGHTMLAAGLSMIVTHNVIHDLANHDPAMRYRIYITMVALFGMFLLVISFFRNKRILFIYTIVFLAIIIAHTVVIQYSLLHTKEYKFVWEHFIVAFTGIIAASFISRLLLEYIDLLFSQNVKDAERIQLQNDALEKTVKERTSALQASNENLQEFAHIVSHDLKEPLRTISGFITLVKKNLKGNPTVSDETYEYMTYVTKGTQQMENLISDILEYSKLNVEQYEIGTLNANALVEDVLSQLKSSIHSSNATIHVGELGYCVGVKRLLMQLFQNLISNAIKYRDDSRQLVIDIGRKSIAGSDCFYVRDNGIGIPAEYNKQIFQAFKRLHSKTKYEGSGVGLAICKKIVDIHQGTIWVENEAEGGSTFYFTLPESSATALPAMKAVVHAD